MKQLLLTLLTVLLIIGAGIGVSAITYVNYVDGVAAAGTDGLEDGTAQGYKDGLREGGEAGYQEGSRVYYSGIEGVDTENTSFSDLYYLYNPSFSEVMNFLEKEELYSFPDIHEYTVTHSIRSGYVRCNVTLNDSRRSEVVCDLVAFDTVDKGLVIIEPWSHKEVIVRVGEEYRATLDTSVSEIDGTVNKVTVLW